MAARQESKSNVTSNKYASSRASPVPEPRARTAMQIIQGSKIRDGSKGNEKMRTLLGIDSPVCDVQTGGTRARAGGRQAAQTTHANRNLRETESDSDQRVAILKDPKGLKETLAKAAGAADAADTAETAGGAARALGTTDAAEGATDAAADGAIRRSQKACQSNSSDGFQLSEETRASRRCLEVDLLAAISRLDHAQQRQGEQLAALQEAIESMRQEYDTSLAEIAATVASLERQAAQADERPRPLQPFDWQMSIDERWKALSDNVARMSGQMSECQSKCEVGFNLCNTLIQRFDRLDAENASRHAATLAQVTEEVAGIISQLRRIGFIIFAIVLAVFLPPWPLLQPADQLHEEILN